MDAHTPLTLPDDGASPDDHRAEQPMLPLDEPVPYALTARARRLVAPAGLPALRLVAASGTDQPHDADADTDPRRSRARALVRSGSAVDEVAAELDVDEVLVAAWTTGLAPPRLRVVGPRTGLVPARTSGADDGAGGGAGGGPDAGTNEPVDEGSEGGAGLWSGDQWEALEAARAEAVRRLGEDPGLRAPAGLLVALLRPDRHALVLAGDDLDLLAGAWRAARALIEADPVAARVLVRVSTETPGDRSAHRVAAGLGLPVGRVVTTRHPSVPTDSTQVRLRVADPDLAALAAGWRAAVLDLVDGRGS